MVYKSNDIALFQSSYNSSRESDKLVFMKNYNLEAFRDIDIPECLNKNHHRTLLMHISDVSEYVYLAYPGSKKNKDFPKHDFIPLVYPELIDLGKLLKITDIFEEFEKINRSNPEILPYLAAMLCRLAYMKDHVLTRNQLEQGVLDFDSKRYTEWPSLDFQFYKLRLNPKIPAFFNRYHGDICDMSPESFFYFMDLLAQNEDMHYWRMPKTDEGWKSDSDKYKGRTNCLLTCVRAIGVITGKSSFADFVKDITRTKVSPATPEEIHRITDGMFSVSDL